MYRILERDKSPQNDSFFVKVAVTFNLALFIIRGDKSDTTELWTWTKRAGVPTKADELGASLFSRPLVIIDC